MIDQNDPVPQASRVGDGTITEKHQRGPEYFQEIGNHADTPPSTARIRAIE